ncbi:MAG: DNA polymerase III subunit gamma/tau [Saprospiraceae bacterium]|nr:DNA polymerase III subunit gamma/tau [Saprospiraceae bacterium]
MSSFVVSARKYRPSRFRDVVGQEHVTNTLKNALRNDHLAHAFLFCGPRGVGKTTCARILAKVLNCRHVTDDFEPCNTCDSCVSFNENASFNITELDAASNNSVEHIRALIEQVRFQPQQGKYKVFIIDEVHMLSQQAFNAFLKTLEEPPPYAIFILATTEKHKIIPTILSRCQIFDFKRIQVPSMMKHLEGICSSEGIQAEPEALHIIAQKADGALRDALSIFDRMVSFDGNNIRYEDVITNLNVLDYDYFFRVVDGILAEDRAEVLLIFNEVLNKGFDPDLFINGLSVHFRDLLVCQDEKTVALLEVSEGVKDRYRQQSAQVSSSFLLTALSLANECDIHYKTALNKRLHVEMALLKMTYAQRAVDLARQGNTPDALPEKKNPEVKVIPKNTLDHPKSSGQVQAPSIQRNEEKDNESSDKAEPNKPDQFLPTEEVLDINPPTTQSATDTPRLGTLDNMLAEIKKSQATKEELRNTQPLNLENITSFFNAYLEDLEQETAKNLLKSVSFSLTGTELKATVSSKLVEGALKAEMDLIQMMRTNFGEPDLHLQIEIDKRLQKKAVKRQKPLTGKEKLSKMYERNPAIKDLAETFGLRIDE